MNEVFDTNRILADLEEELEKLDSTVKKMESAEITVEIAIQEIHESNKKSHSLIESVVSLITNLEKSDIPGKLELLSKTINSSFKSIENHTKSTDQSLESIVEELKTITSTYRTTKALIEQSIANQEATTTELKGIIAKTSKSSSDQIITNQKAISKEIKGEITNTIESSTSQIVEVHETHSTEIKGAILQVEHNLTKINNDLSNEIQNTRSLLSDSISSSQNAISDILQENNQRTKKKFKLINIFLYIVIVLTLINIVINYVKI